LSVFVTAVVGQKSWAELGRNSSVTWRCYCGQSCKKAVGVALVQATPSDACTTSLCTTVLLRLCFLALLFARHWCLVCSRDVAWNYAT